MADRGTRHVLLVAAPATQATLAQAMGSRSAGVNDAAAHAHAAVDTDRPCRLSIPEGAVRFGEVREVWEALDER